MIVKTALCLAALLLVPASTKIAPPEPVAFSPRATIAHYNGLGINVPSWDLTNLDVPLVVVGPTCPTPTVFGPTGPTAANAKAVGNQSWGPILNLGTCITTPGFALIRLRRLCANGASVTLPGGCLGQILQSGPLSATITANHNGVICNVPPQAVPLAAIGASWSAQATVREFGTTRAELSSVLYGVVDACF